MAFAIQGCDDAAERHVDRGGEEDGAEEDKEGLDGVGEGGGCVGVSDGSESIANGFDWGR